MKAGTAIPVFNLMAEGEKPCADLDVLLALDPPPFALLRRQGGDIDILVGDMVGVECIEELPIVRKPSVPGAHELLVVVPYRQIRERGFDYKDDGAPLLAMRVLAEGKITLAEALRKLPSDDVTLLDGQFDIEDETYAETVRTVLTKEIGMGSGANFVLKRSFMANVAHYSPRMALALFARLLTVEQGAYWTFVVYTGKQTFIGATPERHVGLTGGTVSMNPISGTYRYPSSGPTLEGTLDFLADRKETDELFMVLDEELKMMARICTSGGRVFGPHLREMARLAHTEYVLEGQSRLDVREILRETLFAPTVTGSPLESACRVIRRYESDGRGYYSGVLALIGHDAAGRQAMDSAILIRTAEISESGRLRVCAGATLVRHSDPYLEAAETSAKLEGLLCAFGGKSQSGKGVPSRLGLKLARDPLVRRALDRRNVNLAQFWLGRRSRNEFIMPDLAGKRVLVIDAEDTFTAMLRHQLSALGMVVTVCRFDEDPRLNDHDVVILGPGPGDPRDLGDRKIARLRAIAIELLYDRRPLLAVCLGHQVLSGILGLQLMRKQIPNQGAQHTIDYFGVRKTVGFYNTFVALADNDLVYSHYTPGGVKVCRDDRTGEVHVLLGLNFCSTQFHPESVLSPDGLGILRDLLRSLVHTQQVQLQH